MASLTLEDSRFFGKGCLVAAKARFGLKMLFFDLVTIECFRGGLVVSLDFFVVGSSKVKEGGLSLPDGEEEDSNGTVKGANGGSAGWLGVSEDDG